jgi:hypothetical protein
MNHNKSWTAGFIDGEGCFGFTIRCNKRGGIKYTVPMFSVQLRADDTDAFTVLESVLGKGYRVLRKMRYPSSMKWNTCPCIQEIWKSKEQLNRVLSVLDSYPLLAKKKRDYKLWREGVLIYLSDINATERSIKLLEIYTRLRLLRKYI